MNKFDYTVQEARLIKSQNNSKLKKVLSRFIVYLVLWLSSFLSRFFLKQKKNINHKFVFMGRFESNNWIAAHIKPIALSNVCEHIWIVSDEKMLDIENVSYVIPSSKVRKIFGSVIARFYTTYKIAKKNQVGYVGGFHLLLNGIFSHVIAKMNGAQSIYFCVGGWSEIIGGGVYSGTPIFKDIGKRDVVLEKKLLDYIKKIDYVITMGNKAKSYLVNEGGNDRISVNPGGIDPNIFEWSLKKDKDIDLILIARLDPVKRIDRFLKIVKKLKVQLPYISAVVVGGGSQLNDYVSLSRKLGLSDNVKFIGEKTHVVSYLSRSRVFVLTSDSEGLPLSCMEAATLGIPIVASDVGDLSDLVISGKTGFLIQKDSIDDFVSKINRLLTDDELFDSISLAARRKSKDFTVCASSCLWDLILRKRGEV